MAMKPDTHAGTKGLRRVGRIAGIVRLGWERRTGDVGHGAAGAGDGNRTHV